MKKIGILFGKENTFPFALINRINEKKVDDIVAEPVFVDKVMQAHPTEYAVIIDRISQDVPFYRAYLKNAAISGTAVLNNPFWWSADEKFFNNALAEKIGLSMPKTVILPSHSRPDDTDENSFRNLALPLDYETIFNYVGFPAYFKPHAGGGWKNVYKVHSIEELFRAYSQTNQLVMMLQENIDFDMYFRCYCIGGKDVHIMPYEPRNPHHLRYFPGPDMPKPSAALLKQLEEIVLKINNYLGYDINTVEIAMRNGVPYPIDFCNPAPDADVNSVGEANFAWVIEAVANMAIEKAKTYQPGKINLTWGEFVKRSVAGTPLDGGEFKTVAKAAAKAAPKATAEAPAKKAPAKKATK